ncbi:probable serine/threonine-protein kinase PIX13 isoform X2 [Syzygium oleosum]|uniref:probable serine/threonine-protein kinase PIX13 isoform X2 n=1 Tax=Syzygium oleosum TaxID=219896 RepID=UPI0011D27C70|nr:probable serine/threonine-protein kinase PIX13 isoform X2 [Syzygium oleosum]
MGVCYGTPDFPTPSFTGYLKSGMKLTISSSSSSAASNSHDLVGARDNQAFGDGEILAAPNLTVFSFAELKEATKNFRADAQVGEGGFGYVYKGVLHGKQLSERTKTIIAVKRLDQSSAQGYREWLREIEFLGRLSHPNLAKLLGYCREGEDLVLVYEFMPKGSLNNHLFRKGSTAHLPWDVRLKIAIGAARGLAFLHSSCNMIHRNFKTSNILLDASYTARLTDFGLMRSGPPEGESHVSTRVMGTMGYAAPEYVMTGHLYLKSDVYSFGVVSLEILTGLRAFDLNRPKKQHNLVTWVRPLLSSKRKLKTIVGSRLEDNYCIDSAFQIAQLALKCLQKTPKGWPSMIEVVEELESVEAASANRIPRDA